MIIVHVVEPFAAGIAVFVKYLTESMPEDLHIVIHGERRQVSPAADVKKTFSFPNVRFIRWPSAQRSIDPMRDLFALSELYTILKRLKNKNLLDGVHLHSSKSGLLGRIACRLLGIKNVFYTPNGAPFLSANNRISNYFFRQVEKFGNSLGGKVICCSPSELETYLQLGIDAIHINNGIKVEEKAPALIGKKQRFRIITTGRIIGQKNPAFYNSIASYFKEFDQFEFIWAGDGKERHLLKEKNIKVTGWLSQREIKRLVSESDIYISTSLYEGLSFAVLEALTLHKPVLLSHCVGNSDVVKNRINGDLFKTETEAIVKILQYYNNRDMLRVMGNYSKSICDTEFNVKNNFGSYRELYGKSINILPGRKWVFA